MGDITQGMAERRSIGLGGPGLQSKTARSKAERMAAAELDRTANATRAAYQREPAPASPPTPRPTPHAAPKTVATITTLVAPRETGPAFVAPAGEAPTVEVLRPGASVAIAGVPATIVGPCVAGATHAAWLASVSGYNFTVGTYPDALGVLLCPAQGLVSVWRVGHVPARLQSKCVPWVLVSGPGCHVERGWTGGPIAPDACGGGDIGIPLPPTEWRCTGHAFLDTYVSTIAAAYGAPTLLVGILAIGVLSSALCSKIRVDCYVNTIVDGVGRLGIRWSEPIVTVWAMGVCPSGLRKTPMLEHLLAPYRRVQQLRNADQRRLEAAWKKRIAKAQREVDKYGKMEEKNPGYNDDRYTAAYIAASEPPPREPSVIIGSATGPALSEEMAYEVSTVLATSEATAIFNALKKDDGADIEPLLDGYSGSPPGATRRITRKQPVSPAQRCTLVGLTQPKGIYGIGEFIGPRGQGLFARMLWIGAGKSVDCEGTIEEDLSRGWDARLIALTRRQGPVRDAWGVETGVPTYVCLTPEQTARVLALESRFRARIEAGGDLYSIADWARKAHGIAVRVAAVLSSLDRTVTTVEDRFLDWALWIVEHVLVLHAHYVAQVMSWPPGTDDAVHLHVIAQRYLADAGGRGTFTCTEIDRWVKGWDTEQTDAALLALQNRGFISIQGRQRAERIITFRR